MPVPACEHCEDYGVQFVRAEAAYRALLAQVEAVASGRVDDAALDLLERQLMDWRSEVELLRKRLVEMVRNGRIDLPGSERPAATAGTCALCGESLPRLAFPDLGVDAAGALTYQGRALFQPVPSGA
ncbi:MAG TPA: hypothetical protein PLQ13_04055 [Candidatus Krumholzibacteria bacterium]|nr:hypothetical protein [Candidatus Krumholzibacteria bacterium]